MVVSLVVGAAIGGLIAGYATAALSTSIIQGISVAVGKATGTGTMIALDCVTQDWAYNDIKATGDLDYFSQIVWDHNWGGFTPYYKFTRNVGASIILQWTRPDTATNAYLKVYIEVGYGTMRQITSLIGFHTVSTFSRTMYIYA